MRVYLHWHSGKCLFSVRALEGPSRGKVVAHARCVVLADVEFQTQKPGRAARQGGMSGTLVVMKLPDSHRGALLPALQIAEHRWSGEPGRELIQQLKKDGENTFYPTAPGGSFVRSSNARPLAEPIQWAAYVYARSNFYKKPELFSLEQSDPVHRSLRAAL